MTTAEVLRKAKGLLTAETWGQALPPYFSVPPDGKCCMRMAIGRAVDFPGGDPLSITNKGAFLAALTVLTEATGGRDPAPWQDEPGRTLEEVHAAFDRAISLASETAAGKETGDV